MPKAASMSLDVALEDISPLDGLEVKKLAANTFGLFATRPLPRGTTWEYSGEVLTAAEVANRYPDKPDQIGDHCVSLADEEGNPCGWFIDAEKKNANVLKFIRDFRNVGKRNCDMTATDKQAWLHLTKRVAKGEEILGDWADSEEEASERAPVSEGSTSHGPIKGSREAVDSSGNISASFTATMPPKRTSAFTVGLHTLVLALVAIFFLAPVDIQQDIRQNRWLRGGLLVIAGISLFLVRNALFPGAAMPLGFLSRKNKRQ